MKLSVSKEKTLVQELGGSLTNHMVDFAGHILQAPGKNTDFKISQKKEFIDVAVSYVLTDTDLKESRGSFPWRSQDAMLDGDEMEFWCQKFKENHSCGGPGVYYLLKSLTTDISQQKTIQKLEPEAKAFEEKLIKAYCPNPFNTDNLLAATYKTLLLGDSDTVTDKNRDFALNAMLVHSIRAVRNSSQPRDAKTYAYGMSMLAHASMTADKDEKKKIAALFGENYYEATAAGIDVLPVYNKMATGILIFHNLETAEEKLGNFLTSAYPQ
jgi:hypothetical protein